MLRDHDLQLLVECVAEVAIFGQCKQQRIKGLSVLLILPCCQHFSCCTQSSRLSLFLEATHFVELRQMPFSDVKLVNIANHPHMVENSSCS